MEKLLEISRIIDALNDRIGKFAGWLVLVMVLVGVWNVVGRYNFPSYYAPLWV